MLGSWTLVANAGLQRTVKFINDEATSIHGNLKVASVFTSESGEWKLGGFEVLSNVKDDDAVIYVRCRDIVRSQYVRD
jgi:SCY1-like protein 1